MSQIYMPKLEITYSANAPIVKGLTKYDWQVHPTSLLKYIGFSGIGQIPKNVNLGIAARKINAIPILGYYDIFKNYYANKQEDNAYVITPGNFRSIVFDSIYSDAAGTNELNTGVDYTWSELNYEPEDDPVQYPYLYVKTERMYEEENPYTFYDDYVQFSFDDGTTWITGSEAIRQGLANPTPAIGTPVGILWVFTEKAVTNYNTVQIMPGQPIAEGDIKLEAFALENIDKMREGILNATEIGQEFNVTEWLNNDNNILPYSTLTNTTDNDVNYNSFAENGLVVKTYQSDLFNNWIDTEWIEGENGIAALSAVAINNNTLEIDALILGQKIYNLLNRIALSGGTYEDWQDAAYTQGAVRKAETPMYEGGMSAEIMFEEVISNAETMIDGDFQALGSLGGKGTQVGKKGGNNIHVKAKEPIFVMGIVSITPRICYTQGNEWYLTELNTFDDLHKPALDGIGFQDLITEQMAWFGAYYVSTQGGGYRLTRTSAGKTVAWANYMTAVDKAYGDFARPEGKGFMVLARNYELEADESQIPHTYGIKDLTTYIDPAKFNYAFAYTDLAAQNFWVQIHSKIVTRRVMSAHQIPNL